MTDITLDKEKKDFCRRMWIATWVTLALPPLTGIFLLSFVGVFPFPEVIYPFFDYAAIVVICAGLVGAAITRKLIRDIEHLVTSPEEITRYETSLKKLPLYYFSLLFLYFATGLFATLYSLSTLHGFDYKLQKYIISFLGVIPGGLITALPIFFYITDSMGRYLSPLGIHVRVAPIKLKLMVLGLFVPVLIDTLLIMYFYDRTGYLATETIGIWGFLILIAAAGTFMAWRSFQQSMSPFANAFSENEISDYSDINIIPQSLDELGLLSARWQTLWNRVIEFEKQLSIANEHLTTDVRRRTHELETEKIFTEKLLDNSGALIVVLDRGGCIVRFNPACEKATGFTFAELQNKPIWEWLIPPEQLEDVKQVFNSLSEEGFDSQYENDLMTSDGNRIPVSWSNSSIRDESGNVEYIVSIGIDYSERLRNERLLEEARDFAQKASHAKSEFLSRMSHELRTPMNAILGFGQLLRDSNEELSQVQKNNIEEIMQGGHHLLELINEVLDIATIEEGKFEVHIEDTNLSDVIKESLSLLRPQIEKNNIEVINNLPENQDYIVRADPLRLKQVFINLLSNAIKYNSINGSIFIDSSEHENNKLRVSIKDTGAGIPEEMLDKLFIPFERLSNVGNEIIQGTGIGLALTKRMIELMKGEIGVKSIPSKGCTFYFDLPYVKADIPDSKNTKQVTETETASNKPYTLLYVEDNPPNLRLMSQAIEARSNIDFISAHTGPLGLDMAFDHLPDIILLDINLPGINGIEIVKQLKQGEKTKSIPVIGVSANAHPNDIKEAVKAGFNDYLIKPLDINKLYTALDKYLPG